MALHSFTCSFAMRRLRQWRLCTMLRRSQRPSWGSCSPLQSQPQLTPSDHAKASQMATQCRLLRSRTCMQLKRQLMASVKLRRSR